MAHNYIYRKSYGSFLDNAFFCMGENNLKVKCKIYRNIIEPLIWKVE